MIYDEVIMCYSGEERQCLAFVKLGKKKNDDEDSLNHADMTCHPYCNVILSFNCMFLCVYEYTVVFLSFNCVLCHGNNLFTQIATERTGRRERSGVRRICFFENNASIHLDLSEWMLFQLYVV
jgi:hypothetical protein